MLTVKFFPEFKRNMWVLFFPNETYSKQKIERWEQAADELKANAKLLNYLLFSVNLVLQVHLQVLAKIKHLR